MSKKMIVFLIVWALLLAPFGGYVAASLIRTSTSDTPTLHPPKRTISELQAVIDSYIRTRPASEQIPTSKVVSFKRFNQGWYVVTVSQASDGIAIKVKALIGDFYSSASKMRVVVAPNKSLFSGDISNSMGVPYEAISELYR
jgi:hypothetical protein